MNCNLYFLTQDILFPKCYAGFRSRLYQAVLDGSISTLSALKDTPKLESMSEVAYKASMAKVFHRIYNNNQLLEKFGEENVRNEMLNYATEAAKEGSIDSLPILGKISEIIRICCYAMSLMLTNTEKDCVFVKQIALSVYHEKAGEKIAEIFGKSVIDSIPDDYCEDDSGRFRPSPVPFEFSKENIRRLQTFLKRNAGDQGERLIQVLEVWETLAK